MKALIAKESDQILGFTMFGVEAGEVISVAQTAMLGEMPYTVMRDAIYAHPTMAEGFECALPRTSGLKTRLLCDGQGTESRRR